MLSLLTNPFEFVSLNKVYLAFVLARSFSSTRSARLGQLSVLSGLPGWVLSLFVHCTGSFTYHIFLPCTLMISWGTNLPRLRRWVCALLSAFAVLLPFHYLGKSSNSDAASDGLVGSYILIWAVFTFPRINCRSWWNTSPLHFMVSTQIVRLSARFVVCCSGCLSFFPIGKALAALIISGLTFTQSYKFQSQAIGLAQFCGVYQQYTTSGQTSTWWSYVYRQ